MSDAQRRLMDLLAGWAQYAWKCAEAEEETTPPRSVYEAEASAIDDLYQQVGRIEDMHISDVIVFVMGTVSKAVSQGPATTQDQSADSAKGEPK